MNLQPPKCETLCTRISNKKKLIRYDYHLGNSPLHWCTSSTRYHGVIIDSKSKLNWNSHSDLLLLSLLEYCIWVF